MTRRVALIAAAALCLCGADLFGPRTAAAQGQRAVQLGPGPEIPRTLRAAAGVDLIGTWVSVVTEDWRWRMMVPPRGDYAAVPLSADGRQVADNWDPRADEAANLQCKVYGAASVMRMPGRVRISWADDNALRIDADAGAQTRMLRFGGAPAAIAPTWQGTSSAIWQLPVSSAPGAGGGNAVNAVAPTGGGVVAANARPTAGMLKAVTTNMKAGYLRRNGVPYSDSAVLTEYFVRVTAPNGDDWLVVTSIVEDPVYLNEPFVTSSHFKKEPDDSKFAPSPCERGPTGQQATAPASPVAAGLQASDAAGDNLPFEVIGIDIDGYWNDLFHEDLWDRRSGLLIGDFTGVPLNDAGKFASASWDPGWFAIPEEQCRPHTGIYGMRGPTALQITQVVDPATYREQRYDVFLGLTGERAIWVDGRPRPPEYSTHTYAGFSVGAWEGNMLKFTTTHSKAGYLQRNGVPHSDRAVGTEWFVRQGDYLMLIALVDDPGYLEEGLMRTTNWVLDKSPNRVRFQGQVDCGPFQVVDERVGQPKHFVPHYLPGNYEQHKEFQTMYGIPQEAAFGGSETLYPEYQSKLAELQAAFLKRTTAARPAAGGKAVARTDFVGEWRLNRGKSNFEVSWRRAGLDGRDGSAPERRSMQIAPAADGAMSFMVDTQIVANDTGVFRVEYLAKPDGQDNVTKGGAIETFAIKRVDATTLERVGKIKGAVVETSTWKLSPDGKALTITTKGKIEGQDYSNTQLFERVDE